MSLCQRYGLRRVLNAYDKATPLGGARLSPAVAAAVAESLGECLFIEDLQRAAGRAIAEATGAEWGCVTACAAAGITLGVAAAMTGADLGRIAQLPDPAGLRRRVVLPKGHAIHFGAPVAQLIRLAGAAVTEAGDANVCRPWHVRHALAGGDVAAVVAVESYHTAGYGGVSLPDLIALAREAGVPLILDAATQELRLRELVALGPDLVVCSAHKYLGASTAGVVAGRRPLVEALLLQNGGIGRGMKVGKEGIVGVLAAFAAPPWTDIAGWAAAELRKARRLLALLDGLPGTRVAEDPDPNGCPFVRVRLTLEAGTARLTPDALRERLAEGDPAVIVRQYPADRRSVYLNATELRDDEVDLVARAVRGLLRA